MQIPDFIQNAGPELPLLLILLALPGFRHAVTPAVPLPVRAPAGKVFALHAAILRFLLARAELEIGL